MSLQFKSNSLLEIRSFLRDHQTEPKPWESSQTVIERLYHVLRDNRNDTEFWIKLGGLIDRLEEQRFNRTAFNGSVAFGGGGIDGVLAELRKALDDYEVVAAKEPSGRFEKWLPKSMRHAALFSFLLLGLAFGCNESAEAIDGDDDDDDGEICDEAESEDISEDDADDYCELVDIFKTADIDSEDRDELLDCLPDLDAEYRKDLLKMFDQLDEETLNDTLSHPGLICDPGDDDDDH